MTVPGGSIFSAMVGSPARGRRRSLFAAAAGPLAAIALAIGPGLTQAGPIDFVPCCTDLERETRAPATQYAGPLIDGHAHLDPGSSRDYREQLLSLVSKSVVDGLVLMPTPNHGRFRNYQESVRQMADLAARSGGAIRNFCGADEWNTWMGRQLSVSDSSLAQRSAKLNAELNAGKCMGIGEIATRHFEKWAGQAVLTVDFRSRALHALFTIAQKHNVPIELHVEPMEPSGRSHEADAFTELDEIFSRYPEITVILAHTAMTSAANVERLIARYPDLFFNIKIIRKHKKWRNLEPAVTQRNKELYLYEDWAQVFERHPERFFIGSDYKFARKIKRTASGEKASIKRYRKLLKAYRKLLGSLDANAAGLIAHGNARRLFSLAK